jgi:hypothetical protein
MAMSWAIESLTLHSGAITALAPSSMTAAAKPPTPTSAGARRPTSQAFRNMIGLAAPNASATPSMPVSATD